MTASLRGGARAALMVAFMLAAAAAFGQDPRASVVTAAARDWLAIVDRGDAAGAHAAAGERFRTAMAAPVWSAAMAKERGDRGAVVQRSVSGTKFDPPLPGAPPGEFAMIVYRTSFERITTASETLVLERERDGRWRVVGYTIR